MLWYHGITHTIYLSHDACNTRASAMPTDPLEGPRPCWPSCWQPGSAPGRRPPRRSIIRMSQ